MRGGGRWRHAQHGLRAMHKAAARGMDDVLSVLITAGAERNALHLGGETPLMRAATNGHASSVKLLLQHGVHTDSTNGVRPYRLVSVVVRQRSSLAAEQLHHSPRWVTHTPPNGHSCGTGTTDDERSGRGCAVSVRRHGQMGFTARDLAVHFKHQAVVDIFDNPPRIQAKWLSKTGATMGSMKRRDA
jgi:hypothetical protein